jgi:hypothetical protein
MVYRPLEDGSALVLNHNLIVKSVVGSSPVTEASATARYWLDEAVKLSDLVFAITPHFAQLKTSLDTG